MYGKLVRTNVNRKVLFYLRSAVPIHQTLFITSARLHLQYRTVYNSLLLLLNVQLMYFTKASVMKQTGETTTPKMHGPKTYHLAVALSLQKYKYRDKTMRCINSFIKLSLHCPYSGGYIST